MYDRSSGRFSGTNGYGVSGAFTSVAEKYNSAWDQNVGFNHRQINFNASNSSAAYQNGAPVQQRATQMYLYFYVGQFTQSAITQTAGITTEKLNKKADVSMFRLVDELPENPIPGVWYAIPEE